MNIPKLFASFAFIIIIAIASALFTLVKMQELSANTQKMYTHPFTVSNAVADIQTSIITIHRNMKDVVLTSDNLKIITIIENNQKEAAKIHANFKKIYANYLGDKQTIDEAFNAFEAWHPIRQEVIALMSKGKTKEAIAITQGKGALHIENLYKKINLLKEYAFTKAKQFYEVSIKHNGMDTVLLVFLLTLLFAGIVVFFITNSLLKINRTSMKQLHIIDQNILTATLDKDKRVESISSALCRVLQIKKEEVLLTEQPFFFTTQKQFQAFELKVESGKEHNKEVSIEVDDTTLWFNLEVIPELKSDYSIARYKLFLTNITDKKAIEQVSITDTLTGLYNRNYFEMIFEKEVCRAKRDKKLFTMIMLDIDFFKQYNDTYGHQQGDVTLKAVAHVLTEHTNRSYDHAFRVGGEEFMILAYHDNYDSANAFSQHILQQVELLEIAHEKNLASKFVTVSAGVAQFGYENLLTSSDMYKTVDELLYKAKNSGRNNCQSSFID